MYQKIIIIGNLGGDPVQKYTPDGKAVTTFSVATSRRYNDKTETTWFRCTAWGKPAEIISEHFHKGSGILVEGRLTPGGDGSPKTFLKKDGTTAASYEVTVSEFSFLPAGSKSETDEDEVPF